MKPEKIKAFCTFCRETFTARPSPFPLAKAQSTYFESAGDSVLTCPKCLRNYFKIDAGHLKETFIATGEEVQPGDFVSDRVLQILKRAI